LVDKPYFPDKPMKLDFIYFHIGRISVNWAGVETCADTCLRVLSAAAPDPLYKAPRTTKKRIEVLRRLITRVNIPARTLSRGQRQIEEYSRLSHIRNWAIHGDLSLGSFEGKTWRHKGGLVILHRNNLSTQETEYSEFHLSEMEAVGDRILDLASNFWVWLTVDLGCATPKKTENVIRKIRMRTG
jgi:hypothetical protein